MCDDCLDLHRAYKEELWFENLKIEKEIDNHIHDYESYRLKQIVGGAYGKTYIYRDQLFVDNLFSGTKKECELFLRGAYQQRVLQRRDYK